MESSKELIRLRKLFVKNRPIFSALGNEERQQLLLLMFEGQGFSVGELAGQMDVSRPTVSHHLKILRDVGIIATRREGTRLIYRVTPGPYLASMRELIDEANKLTARKG